MILFSVIYTFIKLRYALLIGVSYLFSSLIAQILKHCLFANNPRPKKYFEGLHDLYFVPGIENYSSYSFPSGHATSAFALFFTLTLITGNNYLKFSFFMLALTVAFSRVYLSQHFFCDIYAGSLLGTVIAIAIFYVVEKSRPCAFTFCIF